MAEFARVSPDGWEQGDDASAFARVTPDGWEQVNAAAAPPSTLIGPLLTAHRLVNGGPLLEGKLIQ